MFSIVADKTENYQRKARQKHFRHLHWRTFLKVSRETTIATFSDAEAMTHA
jgi:hypothetical protein